MKLNKKQIILTVIIAVIILAGIIVSCICGFNKELRFCESQRIEILINQSMKESKVKSIANEVLGKDNMVQTIEIYKDLVTIRAKNISDDQKNQIVEKLKEVYEFDQTAEDTTVENIPGTKIIDIYKNYIVPFVIAYVLVALYMIIRYYKKGISKTLLYSILSPIVFEAVIVSLIAITRLPIGRFTTPIILVGYVLSIWYAINKIEK